MRSSVTLKYIFLVKRGESMDKEINSRLMTWVIGHDTGLSSLTLWAAIMNVQNYNADIPHDNSDFGRCYRMLLLCDEDTKKRGLGQLGVIHKKWRPFVDNWDELETLYNKEGCEDKLYSRIVELRTMHEV